MMSLIHRHTFKISNRLAVLAALMLVFAAFSGTGDAASQREAMQSSVIQHAASEHANPGDSEKQKRRLSISLLIFGRG